jgi:hypothetical protein
VFNVNYWIVGLMMEDHKSYLSYSAERNWILINQGSPLCDYKKTYDEVMLAVKQYGIKLPDVSWDADNAQWEKTEVIRERL